jgi:hypothetical protein
MNLLDEDLNSNDAEAKHTANKTTDLDLAALQESLSIAKTTQMELLKLLPVAPIKKNE